MPIDHDMQSMVNEVRNASDLYRPSRFWDLLGGENEQMLSQHGMENLKRTVGQNYFNWLVLHPRNAQLRNVCRDWRAHPTLAPFLNSMEPLDFLHSAVGLEMGITRIGWREEFLYKLFVGMLWELACREDRSGLSQHLEEPLIGNPIRIRRKGKLISQDLANSIREYSTLLEAQPDLQSVPKRVAELGAGYGRLAYVMLQDPGTQYLVFDIPPALAVSQWYLSQVFEREPIFRFRHIESFASIEGELSRSRIAFFTANQLELFPSGYFDVFASISTLPEMTARQVTNYLKIIADTTRRLVYIKQWKSWTNPADAFAFDQRDIRLGGGFAKVIERDDRVQDAFYESVWVRQ
jgi:putative sugar O-methyltransferase